ncbi:MAG: class I SAM-dependent methyltransferase [Planctomycetota bacterium]
MDTEPRVSEHHRAGDGEVYAKARLDATPMLGHQINASVFRPHLGSSDSVLDFGCGVGGMMEVLASNCGSIEGFDINPSLIAQARERGFEVIERYEDLPVQRYDVVYSNHVLQHIPDVAKAIEKIRETIKPQGLLAVKLPIDDPNARLQRRWSADDADHHLFTWSPKLFANLLYECGFDVLECRVITYAWHPKLLPLKRVGLLGVAGWALATVLRRRQLFALARA